MKKYAIILGIITSFLMAGVSTTKAQLSVSINIGSQPQWGPVGYDRADYYYLPDIECYYSVPNRQFIYLSNGRWVFAASLPGRYANYDLYSGYKVVVNRPRPYLNFDHDRAEYSRYRGWRGKQPIIRDSRDERYHGNPHGMPPGQAKKYDRGDEGRGDQGRGNSDHGRGNDGDHGNGNGHGRGHDN